MKSLREEIFETISATCKMRNEINGCDFSCAYYVKEFGCTNKNCIEVSNILAAFQSHIEAGAERAAESVVGGVIGGLYEERLNCTRQIILKAMTEVTE